VKHLRAKNDKRLGEDLLRDAASRTWSDFCKKPGGFDGKGSLWSYLKMSAQRDLQNALAKEARRRQHENHDVDVEQCSDDGKLQGDGDEAAATLLDVARRERPLPMPRCWGSAIGRQPSKRRPSSEPRTS
jgi:hypothetical protein